MPARSIHSASDLAAPSLNWRRAFDELGAFLCEVDWWCSGSATSLLWRFVSLNGPARVELLLLAWRVRDVLRECERMGGVLGTETLLR